MCKTLVSSSSWQYPVDDIIITFFTDNLLLLQVKRQEVTLRGNFKTGNFKTGNFKTGNFKR